jgi:hypothetical protein
MIPDGVILWEESEKKPSRDAISFDVGRGIAVNLKSARRDASNGINRFFLR